VLYFCVSWTPANSIGARAAHPSRIRVLSEHRESTDPSQSHRKGPGSSPKSVPLFSRRLTPLSPFPQRLRAHRLSKDRADGRTDSRKRKWFYSAQFWCNLNPLDATLMDLPASVANKRLTVRLSSLDATLTKRAGGYGGVRRHSRACPIPLPYFHSSSPEVPNWA
jgi:hypothetical protein